MRVPKPDGAWNSRAYHRHSILGLEDKSSPCYHRSWTVGFGQWHVTCNHGVTCSILDAKILLCMLQRSSRLGALLSDIRP